MTLGTALWEGKTLKGVAPARKLRHRSPAGDGQGGNPVDPMVAYRMQQACGAFGEASRQGGEEPRRRTARHVDTCRRRHAQVCWGAGFSGVYVMEGRSLDKPYERRSVPKPAGRCAKSLKMRRAWSRRAAVACGRCAILEESRDAVTYARGGRGGLVKVNEPDESRVEAVHEEFPPSTVRHTRNNI